MRGAACGAASATPCETTQVLVPLAAEERQPLAPPQPSRNTSGIPQGSLRVWSLSQNGYGDDDDDDADDDDDSDSDCTWSRGRCKSCNETATTSKTTALKPMGQATANQASNRARPSTSAQDSKVGLPAVSCCAMHVEAKNNKARNPKPESNQNINTCTTRDVHAQHTWQIRLPAGLAPMESDLPQSIDKNALINH